jgi:hypothetical protein
MKKFFKLLGIIALVAIMGFSMAACDTGGDDGGGTKGGLTAPTGFTATAYSSSSIILTWNAVSGATGYNVYNGTSPSNLNGPGTVSSNYANNYNLPANTTVYYQIAAYNANGEGPRSNVVSATTLSANNYSLNGVWEGENGYQVRVSGSTATLLQIPGFPIWVDALNKGYISIGGTIWRNLTSTGNLRWSGETVGINWSGNRDIATGITWQNTTIIMSADGKTINYEGGQITYTRR